MLEFASNPRTLPVYHQLDGIFLLDKPSGPSSAQCLRIFKKMGQKKIGHAGTLDPMASGLLLVLLGNATKLASYLQEGRKKIYNGTLKLGEESDTWDKQGTILVRKDPSGISEAQIQAEITSWRGEQEQEVPPFSAAKLNGKSLYKLARQGLPTPTRTKKINIFEADILDIRMPFVNFRVTCSSGSYIRSLAHSLGKRLGCGGILYELIREYSHPYGLDNATSLDALETNPGLLSEGLLHLKSALPDWEIIEVSNAAEAAIKNGQAILANGNSPKVEKALLCRENRPLALARMTCSGNRYFWTIIRGLWN